MAFKTALGIGLGIINGQTRLNISTLAFFMMTKLT